MSLRQLIIPRIGRIAVSCPDDRDGNRPFRLVYYDHIRQSIRPPGGFSASIGFEWDQGNSMKNEKHSVSDAEAEQVFFNEPLLLLDDSAHTSSESRWHALGRTNEHRLLKVAFTLRTGDTRVRIISARPMHRKERKAYEQATQANS
jgi:uncharacterized protein